MEPRRHKSRSTKLGRSLDKSLAYIELELTEEAEKLGVSKIACNEGVFVIIWSEKEYSYAFPSPTLDKNQQATLEYLS